MTFAGYDPRLSNALRITGHQLKTRLLRILILAVCRSNQIVYTATSLILSKGGKPADVDNIYGFVCDLTYYSSPSEGHHQVTGLALMLTL